MALPWSRKKAEPLPPGERGRILFVAPFLGGVGGVERLARIFADWVRDSGYTCTAVFEHTNMPPGPYDVEPSDTLRVLESKDWSDAIATADYDFAYIMPSGLGRKRWLPRLERVGSPRVVLDLDPRRKYLSITDVLHCETPRDEALPRPHVVALPDPFPTMPSIEGDVEPRDAYLTAFTPYGEIKGHQYIQAFLDATDKRLIWCYDPITFARRKKKYARNIMANVESIRHPRLERVEAPSRDELYRLYHACAGYVCFSQSETLGFSMLDAVALGKPLCARRIGVCRALEGFRPTEDFSNPVFETYPLPDTGGYEGLFRDVGNLSIERVR